MSAAVDVERDLREFAAGYRLGWANGLEVGRALGAQDADAVWTAVLTGCAETWRRPRYAELERAREVDYQPCSARCRRCSRCIASIAYWSRGGRPYLGVEQEVARARGAA